MYWERSVRRWGCSLTSETQLPASHRILTEDTEKINKISHYSTIFVKQRFNNSIMTNSANK